MCWASLTSSTRTIFVVSTVIRVLSGDSLLGGGAPALRVPMSKRWVVAAAARVAPCIADDHGGWVCERVADEAAASGADAEEDGDQARGAPHHGG